MLQAKKLELDQNKAYLHVLYELRLPQKLEKLKVFWKLDLILQGKSLIQKSNVWNRSKFSKFISNAPSKINEKLNRSTIWCHALPKGFVKFFVFFINVSHLIWNWNFEFNFQAMTCTECYWDQFLWILTKFMSNAPSKKARTRSK